MARNSSVMVSSGTVFFGVLGLAIALTVWPARRARSYSVDRATLTAVDPIDASLRNNSNAIEELQAAASNYCVCVNDGHIKTHP